MSKARHSLEHSLIAAKTYMTITGDYLFWINAKFDAQQSQNKKTIELAMKSMNKHLALFELLKKLNETAKDKDIIDKAPILCNQKTDYVPTIRETASLMLRYALAVRGFNPRPIYYKTVRYLNAMLVDL